MNRFSNKKDKNNLNAYFDFDPTSPEAGWIALTHSSKVKNPRSLQRGNSRQIYEDYGITTVEGALKDGVSIDVYLT